MHEMVLVFNNTFLAILQIFLVAVGAGLLVRAKVISQSHIQGMAAAIVLVFLPCMIFSNTVRNFDPNQLTFWWVLPLSAVVMAGAGLALGGIVFMRELPQKRNLLSLTSLQNAAYLALPVGQALFPKEFDSQFSLYTFLYLLGLSPLLWSVGKFLVTTGHHERLSWRGLISPPFCACVLSLILVFTGLRRFIPVPVGEAVHLLGQATVPVATFVLGASLGSIHLRIRPYLFDAARALFVKLVLLPWGMLLILHYAGINGAFPVLGGFFIIQAASAPATSTIVQIRHYGGDEQKIGSILFLGYIACAVTLPFWFAAWRVMG